MVCLATSTFSTVGNSWFQVGNNVAVDFSAERIICLLLSQTLSTFIQNTKCLLAIGRMVHSIKRTWDNSSTYGFFSQSFSSYQLVFDLFVYTVFSTISSCCCFREMFLMFFFLVGRDGVRTVGLTYLPILHDEYVSLNLMVIVLAFLPGMFNRFYYICQRFYVPTMNPHLSRCHFHFCAYVHLPIGLRLRLF